MSYEVCGTVTWVLTAVYVAVMPVYLRLESRNAGHGRSFVAATTVKLVLSALFAVTSLISYRMSIESYAIHPDICFLSLALRVAGLACWVPADLLLQYIRLDGRRYRAGIVCFLAGQILFAVSLVLMDLLSGWFLTAILVAAGLFIMLAIMRAQRWQLGQERSLIMIYAVLLVLVPARALVSMLISPTASSLLMFLGAVLFLVSDVILSIWNYHSPDIRGLQNANWITYFSAAMLIALSVSPMFDVPLR